MKKFLTLLFAIIISAGNFALADGDLWDNFGDPNVYGQKPVSDKEFEQAIESKKGKKKKDKNIPKGESFQQSNETNAILNSASELPVLLIPLTLENIDHSKIPVGHYQVEGKKENGQVNIIAIVILIGIAIMLALIFKDRISTLIGSLFDTIDTNAQSAVSN